MSDSATGTEALPHPAGVTPAPRETRPGAAATAPTTVAIAGTGFIADFHAAALRKLGTVEIVGACDPNGKRLDAFRSKWGIPYGAGPLEELLRDRKPQVVHVLTPPALHFGMAEQILEAGSHVFIEKPMALRAAECDRLLGLARERGLRVGVNHNLVYNPFYQRLLRDVEARAFGDVRHVVSVNTIPLAQLAAGEHDHWMFRSPENVLFELGPHPFSLVCKLLGPVRSATALGSDGRRLRGGAPFHGTWQVALACERGNALVLMSFDRSFPEVALQVVGEDASAHVDLLGGSYVLDRRTRFMDPVDTFVRGLDRARRAAWQGAAGFTRFGLSTLKLIGEGDLYYSSMRDSITAFHRSLAPGGPAEDSGEVGRQVIDALERAAAALTAADPAPAAAAAGGVSAQAGTAAEAPRPAVGGGRDAGEVLVLGGTGFIGRALVDALTSAGHPVRLMARRPALAPAGAAGGGGGVSVVPGDIRNADDVDRAVQGCRTVIHLVAGAPATWPEYEELYLKGTTNVAEACLRHGVSQLLFASTIAVYYLGDRNVTVTEATPLDVHPERRNIYTRAKIATEELLTGLYRTRGLPVTIFRPGVVIGAGGVAEHVGVGDWPSRTHCVSWGKGNEPVPFVLVDDVAAAFAAAVGRPGLEGKSFNLVGDVRPTAVEYVDLLRKLSRRRIALHRQSLLAWWAGNVGKWGVKVAARKKGNRFPSYRDLASRTSASQFDCAAAKEQLGWRPVADRERFVNEGVVRALGGDARS